MPDAPLDGNAAAGVLSEVFNLDLTTAVSTCAGCGAVACLGRLPTFVQAPGIVLQCSTCGSAQLRLVRGSGRCWLDLRGMRVLQVELAPDA